MSDYKYQGYLTDFFPLLKENIEDLYKELLDCKDEDKSWIQGQIFQLYRVLELAKSQAIAFDIELSELGLNDYNPGKYLKD
jgi:hypothetical protein